MTIRAAAAVALIVGGSAALVPSLQSQNARQAPARVAIRPDTTTSRFDVTVDGKPFTTYRYGPEFKDKPVFYPVMAPSGARVNREYPMVAAVPGETNDHPHHQSMFFAYDEVNGTNFWNPDPSSRRIAHIRTSAANATLTSLLAWTNKDGVVVLDETKRVTFGGARDTFWMDHDITLTARVPTTLGDTKEGAFAIRLNDTLKETGGTGRYVNAEGLETAANVWGKTSAWVAIRGTVKDATGAHDVTVAIMASPTSLNSPPYWHARDYGLFAVNPFGRKSFDPKAAERITRLGVGDQVHVRFRLAVYEGQVEKARLDRDYAGLNTPVAR